MKISFTFSSSFVFFALSSLLFSSLSSARPLSLISLVPGPTPAPTSKDGQNIQFDRLSSDEMNISTFTDSNILNISDIDSTLQNLLDFPRLDLSSLHFAPDVESICSGTDYVPECVLSILPLLHKRNTLLRHLRANDVLQMEMKALFDKANVTLGFTKHLINDPATPPAIAEILDTCVDNYESLLNDLVDATTAVDDSDFGRLESLLSASIADVVTCTDAFADEPELESPVAKVDEFLKKLCSNVLAISQMIKM